MKIQKKRKQSEDGLDENGNAFPKVTNEYTEKLKIKKAKKLHEQPRQTNGIRIAIDLDFDTLMNDREIKSLAQQIMFSYGANQRAEKEFDLYLTTFKDKIQKRMAILSGFNKWTINTTEKSYHEVFNKNELIYLTSESPNVITSLDPTKVYVIGGIVDHNRHKGITYLKAQEKGIQTGQLPISEFISIASRKVLAVNHVFEILLKYTENPDWEKAFLTVIPARKGIAPKQKDGNIDSKSENSSTKGEDEDEELDGENEKESTLEEAMQ